MKTVLFFSAVCMAIGFASCNGGNEDNLVTADSFTSANPFFQKSNLPFEAPDFTKIKDADFRPAMEEGMRQQLAEMNAIANDTAAPTFDNTLVAMEKTGALLNRVYGVFNLLSSANTDSVLQALSEEQAPKMAELSDAIYLNPKLIDRVKALYDHRDTLQKDAESKRLLEKYYQDFILAGANLSDSAKNQMKALNKEEASISAKFTNQLLAAAKAGALVVSDKALLAGLSEGDMEADAQNAKDNNQAGKWMISLQNTTQQPALQSLSNRTTRQQLFEASWNRAEKGDSNDTRSTISRLAEIRAQQAKLLGFKNFASWKLQNQMAKEPGAVDAFLAKLTPAATAKARKEAAEIQAVIDQQKGGFQVQPWDWNFYAEQVRKAKYDLDENEVKPYFELNNVLQNGVFYAANLLYGLTFKERKDLPVYQEDVRVFEVIDKDNQTIGLFYCDYFKRDNKSGGAWMDNIVGQSHLLGTKPVIYNVCNFTKPAKGQPALISFSDVTTMFHEFGHALHGLFANQQYPSLSGTNTARDFVEFPSQFNEHWAMDTAVFSHYATHYKTGEKMPALLVSKIKNAAAFNQGYMLTELLAAAKLDMAWHSLSADAPLQNVDEFEKQSLQNAGLALPQVPPRYRSSYFLHIWSNGYAAGYYAYLWTEMLDDDAFQWFKEHGGLTRENGQRFRDMVLSRGNTEDLATMYRNFRGHDPDILPMLQDRGLVEP